ncbi:hypothetical protein PC123_g24760 [Phytophthora cactorum]|nr:hypothetical protein PC123_g24760 [Phytophthora cactorum]
MNVVQPATNVRLDSSDDTGAPDQVTITLEGICPYDEPPTLCSMIISSEDSATGPEVQDTTDETIVPVLRVHSEFSGDTGVSAPVTATPGGIRPGNRVPTSRAANIAIADSSVSTHMLKAMPTEMNPALSIRLECGVDSGTTETATVTLDETCVSVAHVSSVTDSVDLQESLPPLAAQSKYVPTVRTNPYLLYAKLPRDYRGFVMSFYGSAKTGKYGGYGSCSWILWRLPEWKIVIAANAYLSFTTINLAEYTGMNNGVKTAIAHGAKNLVIVGDSRLAIQQSLGVIACRQESLLALLNVHKELTTKLRSVKYRHIVRECNAAANSLATEALESKVSRVVLVETRKSELVALNRIQEVIYEPGISEVRPRESEHCVHVLTGNEACQQKTIETFMRDGISSDCSDYDNIAVMTRRQPKTRKHDKIADEPSFHCPKASLGPDNAAEQPPWSRFEAGRRVWLYMERGKPGLTKNLAHRWYGPFRIKRQVESILDDRTPMATSTQRSGREFEVKWVGNDEPTWEPASNLSCCGLLYDYLCAEMCERR